MAPRPPLFLSLAACVNVSSRQQSSFCRRDFYRGYGKDHIPASERSIRHLGTVSWVVGDSADAFGGKAKGLLNSTRCQCQQHCDDCHAEGAEARLLKYRGFHAGSLLGPVALSIARNWPAAKITGVFSTFAFPRRVVHELPRQAEALPCTVIEASENSPNAETIKPDKDSFFILTILIILGNPGQHAILSLSEILGHEFDLPFSNVL